MNAIRNPAFSGRRADRRRTAVEISKFGGVLWHTRIKGSLKQKQRRRAETSLHKSPSSTPSRVTADRVAFIDFEASGLSPKSWPVEIGWAFADGDPVAHLIRPDESWPVAAWDPAAETLHGLSQKILHKKGEEPGKICEIANQALAGFDVYSDAPDWDGFWLYRLFNVARVKPAFVLRDFTSVMGEIAVDRQKALFEIAQRSAPRRHRAADDARHLQTLFNLACAEQGAAPAPGG